jgi:hypothetical protein
MELGECLGGRNLKVEAGAFHPQNGWYLSVRVLNAGGAFVGQDGIPMPLTLPSPTIGITWWGGRPRPQPAPWPAPQ